MKKEEYKQISQNWKGDVYQNWKRIKERLSFFCKHIDCLKGLDVTEAGCNAGLYGYEIAKVAKSYTGVEISYDFYRQALVTAEYIENPNVKFHCLPVKGFLNRGEKIEALFMSFVLYHLSDEELGMLKKVLPDCKVVLIQTRTRKRSVEKNSYKLWKPKNVDKFLQAAGFTTKTHWHKCKQFCVTVGKK